MPYDYKSRKIVALIADDLESWQGMNVLGHMAVALGANKDPELMGREVLTDQSGVQHMGIARFGFIIKKGSAQNIAQTIRTARENESLTVIDFPREMLDTRHDDALAESIESKPETDFEYLGDLLYGPTVAVDQLTQDFPLWS